MGLAWNRIDVWSISAHRWVNSFPFFLGGGSGVIIFQDRWMIPGVLGKFTVIDRVET